MMTVFPARSEWCDRALPRGCSPSESEVYIHREVWTPLWQLLAAKSKRAKVLSLRLLVVFCIHVSLACFCGGFETPCRVPLFGGSLLAAAAASAREPGAKVVSDSGSPTLKEVAADVSAEGVAEEEERHSRRPLPSSFPAATANDSNFEESSKDGADGRRSFSDVVGALGDAGVPPLDESLKTLPEATPVGARVRATAAAGFATDKAQESGRSGAEASVAVKASLDFMGQAANLGDGTWSLPEPEGAHVVPSLAARPAFSDGVSTLFVVNQPSGKGGAGRQGESERSRSGRLAGIDAGALLQAATASLVKDILKCFRIPPSALSLRNDTSRRLFMAGDETANTLSLRGVQMAATRREPGVGADEARETSPRGVSVEGETGGRAKGSEAAGGGAYEPEVFQGIAEQVLGLATDFDGTVTDTQRPAPRQETPQGAGRDAEEGSTPEGTGTEHALVAAQKEEPPQEEYVDTCVTLFALAKKRASDPAVFDAAVDEAVKIYSAGVKKIMTRLLSTLPADSGSQGEKARATRSGDSSRWLGELGGLCACPATVEAEKEDATRYAHRHGAPVSPSASVSPSSSLASSVSSPSSSLSFSPLATGAQAAEEQRAARTPEGAAGDDAKVGAGEGPRGLKGVAAGLRHAVEELDAYEQEMANTPLTRFILQGIRRDTFESDLLEVANSISLIKPVALETIVRLRALGKPVTFISHSWSSRLLAVTLRHAVSETLSSCLAERRQRRRPEAAQAGEGEGEDEGEDTRELSATWAATALVEGIQFYANELVFDENGISTGVVEPRCVTLDAKRRFTRHTRKEALRLMRRRFDAAEGAQAPNATGLEGDASRGTRHEKRGDRDRYWLVFVGDTYADILALLEADIGIIMGSPNRKLEGVLFHGGVVLRPLAWLTENFRRQLQQHQATLSSSFPSATSSSRASRARGSFRFRLPSRETCCCCPAAVAEFPSQAEAAGGERRGRCRVLYVAQNWGEIYELLFGEWPTQA
ncbi:hypothetical protein BESB_027510 [Besnoitia besnoiti]|uniref:Transmembrane protein n=1 Tax=Besnoitia besnoiti TaxID=94643 RepID=A0A2A9M606_BESBE|nr:uncharacterized protein BESB_027510 [Besnoitia besnoiti]PFH31316.1 hypothetical protein BESB_027510 [Besnoitia besnoiti]